MGLSYTWERFNSAVLTLAQGRGTLSERLGGAFEAIAILMVPREPTHLPTDELREKVEAVWAVAQTRPSAAESAAALSEIEAHTVIADIVGVYNDVCRMLGAEDARRARRR
jgi:hypothetical protein